MTDITADIAGAVTISGLSAASVDSGIDVDIADPISIFGYPAFPVSPAPTATPTPDAVRARVLDAAGTFIAHLPHAKGLSCMDEHNTPGSGQIDVRRYEDTETAHPTLWSPGNQILISVGGRDIFRLVIDAQGGYTIDTADKRDDTWAGTGALGILNSGMVAPEYGWRSEATEERSFDYGSNPNIGGWFVSSEWHTPVGKKVRDSWRWTYKKRHLPKRWPDRRSQWLWWRNPDSTSGVNETNYFIGSFTLNRTRRVKIWVAGDDTLEFQLDGEVRITTGPGGWKKASTLVMDLSAGVHYIAAKVTNTPASSGNQNRSGFICAVGHLNGNHEISDWILRSSPSTFRVRRQLGSAPGWKAAQILRQLVAEQQSRGCAGHAPITFGFTTEVDSAGVPWTGRMEQSLTVGTLGLDMVARMVELGIDVYMTPDLVLHAYNKRGVDRSSTVRIDQGDGKPMEESSPQLPAIRNALYAKSLTGWAWQEDSASIAARGRRETMASLGEARSQAQTQTVINQMLPDLSGPPPTIEVKISGTVGPQPYRDFFVSDWLSYRASGKTTWGRYRVMSISMEVTESEHPDWTLQLYEN